MNLKFAILFTLVICAPLANAWSFDQLIQSHVIVGSEVRQYLYEDGEVRELPAVMNAEACAEKAARFSPDSTGVLIERFQRLSAEDRAFYNLGTNPGLVARTVAFCFAVVDPQN